MHVNRRDFEDVLLQHFPEWRRYAPESELVPFALHVPRPDGLPGPGLGIELDGWEVTIWVFDVYHDHIDWNPHANELEEGPIAFILDIVEERLVLRVFTEDGKVLGACPEPPGASGEDPSPGYVRSWRGTYDREIDPEQPNPAPPPDPALPPRTTGGTLFYLDE